MALLWVIMFVGQAIFMVALERRIDFYTLGLGLTRENHILLDYIPLIGTADIKSARWKQSRFSEII